ncbi:hypothetical protein HEP87_54860 [Streptomyces sp. S1D4-11]
MNIQLLLEALDIQEDAARALADDLRAQIQELQGRLREARPISNTSRPPGRPSPLSLTGSRPGPPRPNCPSTRTTLASSPSSTRPPAPCGTVMAAKPSTTNSCRRTSKAPTPN